MLRIVAHLATRHSTAVCGAWLFASLLLFRLAPDWKSKAQDDDIRFLPARCASVRGHELLERAFPDDVFASRAILALERVNAPLTAEDWLLVDRIVEEIKVLARQEPDLQLGSICSYRDSLIGKRLISADEHCTLIQVSLATPFLANKTRVAVDRIECIAKRCLSQGHDGGLCLYLTGPAGLGRDVVQTSERVLNGTSWATIGLVILVLLLVYRAPLLALVPLITIGVSVWVALHLLALLTLIPGVHLVDISKVFAIVILYGAGTDYCLFLISRYQEELGKTTARSLALRRTVRAVGGALAASAGTVICGLGMMGFAEFAKVRCAGPAIALGLMVAFLASISLAPALLQLLGKAVFWPARQPSLKASLSQANGTTISRAPFWERMSRLVLARPALVWASAVLALAPLVILGLFVEPTYKSTGELAPSAPSIRGIAAIQRHFTTGEIGPTTVLLASSSDWDSSAGRQLIAHLSRGFSLLPNVAEVRSLTQPLGQPVAQPLLIKPAPDGAWNGLVQSFQSGLSLVADRAALRHYVADMNGDDGARHVTRLDVVFRSDPFDHASAATFELLQTWLHDEMPAFAHTMKDLQAETYGVTVSALDIAAITEADRNRVNGLVLSGILLILLAVVRKPWLAVYLLVSVLFSYYATLGATVLAGYWWAGRPLSYVEWRVPFFLFTILIAVGEDYNILLVTRVLQETRRQGFPAGVGEALARTGGTITSCGLIMAGTFATLMVGGLGTLMQIGFALAFGVLMDTFVVRPFLVPAFMLMVWRQARPPKNAQVIPQLKVIRLAG
jgi:RND superfamily putative drug exporter